TTAPHYGFTILNRVGVENFTEVLDEGMSFQVSDQIIIYTSQRSGIVGVWIYEEADRARIPEQLGACCADLNAHPAGCGVQTLYPQNAEEVSEFRRTYPRSRSNSRKDGGADAAGTNPLSAFINQTRQQQEQQQQGGGLAGASNGTGGDAAAAGLASKLQAIGLDVSGGARVQPQNAGANGGAPALYADPAIIMARKSVNPQDMNANDRLAGKQYSPTSTDASDGASFKSPLPMPSTYGQPANNNVGGHAMRSGQPLPQAPSPVLHPVQATLPPSVIATPLPAQGLPTGFPGPVPGAAGMQPGPMFWGPPPRSVHASPAPVGFVGVPAMASYSPMPGNHPAASQIPQPPVHMMHPHPQMVAASGPSGPNGTTPSVAQNLAEQLVSLVRQRMNSVHQSSGASPMPRAASAQPPPGQPASAIKAQRDYCREWLIRVIQADDELVDAFAQRFPPPIATPQPQYQGPQ
ncbi:hypothetical protein H4R19_002640, partial [Coemansia spiralis]